MLLSPSAGQVDNVGVPHCFVWLSAACFSQVVQQQKAECSQKLEGLNAWLAGAAGLLANQRAGPESGDVSALQDRQKKLKVKNDGSH